MLVSCSYCGGTHNRGVRCQNKPTNNSRKKDPTYITRFRSSRLWNKKREEIKTRDKYMCVTCLKNGKYIFRKLEVHHITPISKAWEERLNNSNLITLCVPCHKMAENGDIKKGELLEMVKNVDAF
jgi:5-methylcytosine-specific restriction endonuclease McrA